MVFTGSLEGHTVKGDANASLLKKYLNTWEVTMRNLKDETRTGQNVLKKSDDRQVKQPRDNTTGAKDKIGGSSSKSKAMKDKK